MSGNIPTPDMQIKPDPQTKTDQQTHVQVIKLLVRGH